MAVTGTKLQIGYRDANGKDGTLNVGYCNPNADDGVLKEFAQKTMGLTTNTFKEVYKVTTEDITSAKYYEYTVTPESDTITIESTGDFIVPLVTNFPSNIGSVAWTMQPEGLGGVITMTPTRRSGTSIYEGYVRVNSAMTATGTITYTPSQGSTDLAKPVTVTFNINISE